MFGLGWDLPDDSNKYFCYYSWGELWEMNFSLCSHNFQYNIPILYFTDNPRMCDGVRVLLYLQTLRTIEISLQNLCLVLRSLRPGDIHSYSFIV
jgi:hypothetical protein